MASTLKRFAPALAGITVLIALILYLGGFFRTGLIGPEDAPLPSRAASSEGQRVQARLEQRPLFHEAVGTVQARSALRIEAQVVARANRIAVRTGDFVRVGQVLVELDDRELRARHAQAREALNAAVQQQVRARRAIDAADALFVRSQAQHERIRAFLAAEAATAQEMEQVEAELRQAEAGRAQARASLAQAEAGVEGAKRALEQAEVQLDHVRILSPLAGQIVERLVEPGDLAAPGKPLLSLQSASDLRLEALVPEALIERMTPGMDLVVEIGGRELRGVLEERVPAADSRARSFLVKVGLPGAGGLYPGMFGRLRVPLDARPAVLVPLASVRRVGQLELVRVVEDEQVKTLLVTTGSRVGEDVEVLSGLKGGEILLIEGEQP